MVLSCYTSRGCFACIWYGVAEAMGIYEMPCAVSRVAFYPRFDLVSNKASISGDL